MNKKNGARSAVFPFTLGIPLNPFARSPLFDPYLFETPDPSMQLIEAYCPNHD